MKSTITLLIALIALAGSGCATDAYAQGGTLLGQRHVRDLTDTDTIQVGRSRGAFSGLRVEAKGSAVEFKRVVIHFENGSRQTIEKNRLLGRGDSSRVLRLDGAPRYIDRVVLTYEARSKGWKGAEIMLYGVR